MVGSELITLTCGTLCSITFILSHLVLVAGLQCWQCIGDDCHQDPALLENAKPKICQDGTSCLKVYYRVKAAKTNLILESTTRTCSSGYCLERNDFVNCTNDKVENPGCMRQYCCADRDMCNMAPHSTSTHLTLAILAFVALWFTIPQRLHCELYL